jgi:predicted CopG family antitoxin
MKNITVSVEDDVYRRARMKAAEQDTSVSALVKKFLASFASDGGEFARLMQDEEALRERIGQFRAADRIPRDQLHERRR